MYWAVCSHHTLHRIIANASVLTDGLGPLLFSPLSEVPSYGRNIPYITSLIIFVILCVPTALVDNYAGLMVLRLLQGFFGSPCLASGGASMADMVRAKELPIVRGCLLPLPELIRCRIIVLGYLPTARIYQLGCCGVRWTSSWSGFVGLFSRRKGVSLPIDIACIIPVADYDVRWRWAMWEILWMGAPILVLMVVCLPETSADNILLRRARRLRRVTGNSNISSQSEIAQNSRSFPNMLLDTLIKPVEIMAKDPAILFANLYTSLVYGIYYSFFEAFPLTYPAKYGLDAKDVALIFISIIIGCALAVVVYIIYLYTSPMPALKANGQLTHENRLAPALFASFGPTVGLFIFGK